MYILEFDGLFHRFNDEPHPSSQPGLLGYGWLITWDKVIVARGPGHPPGRGGIPTLTMELRPGWLPSFRIKVPIPFIWYTRIILLRGFGPRS